ncbi:MAG: hypothetical protein IH895_10000 [Planctomycetes bacterium]|nr:hypothetical protein [Planctomycetota bacterium]
MGPLILPELGDAILHGSRPWMLALLGLVAVAAIGVTVNDLHRRVKSSSSTSYLVCGGYRRQFLLRSQFVGGWTFALSRGEHQIDAWKSGRPRWTWWNRVRRWRVGNAPFRSVPVMLMFPGFFVAFWFLFQRMSLRGPTRPPWTSQDFSGLRAQFLVMVIALLLMTAGRAAYAWRARLLTLPLEFLRPYTRRALQNEMAVAFVLDLVPPVLVVAAIGAVGINLDSELRVAWERVPIDFLLAALACLAMTVGVGAVMVVVQRDWLVLVLILTIIIVTAVTVSLVTIAQVSPEQMMQRLPPRVIEAQLCVTGAIGIVLAWLMRRRFMAMEIGSRV